MKRQIEFSAWLLGHVTAPVFVCTALAVLALSVRSGFAEDEFQQLVNQIPRSANAVVLLNMEKAKNSPLGLKENWSAKVEQAFESGLTRVPPQATRFVLASEIDFEFMEPIWEAAVMELGEDLSATQIEKMRHGTPDTIEGLPAVRRPNDTYIVKLATKLVGAMAPANRQAVVRWIRDVRKSSPSPLSPYLQRAAVFSDDTGSEIIMALDLEGVMSFERVGKYLKSHPKEMKEWGADLVKTAQLLSNVQGIRIGVRIGETQSSKIVVDFGADASPLAAFAKPLLLHVLADKGALIEDFQSWTVQTKGNELSLTGPLSASGRRRLMSVIESPAQEDVAANAPSVSPGELPAITAKKSREYFRAVVGMANDLKSDMRNAKNLASTSLFFDKYAKRIERMPMLGVDEDLLNYSAYVANTLRQATGSVKNMGIQSGVRQAQIISSSAGYGYMDYSVGRFGAYGGYGASGTITTYDPVAEAKGIYAERRVVKAEEKATMATDVQTLRQNLIAATTDIRRKMTQKYQVEF